MLSVLEYINDNSGLLVTGAEECVLKLVVVGRSTKVEYSIQLY